MCRQLERRQRRYTGRTTCRQLEQRQPRASRRSSQVFQYSCGMRPRLRSRTDDLTCIVLAAGGSRRLGRPKQLVRHRQRALLLRAVDAAEAVVPGRIVVVLGADAPRLRAMLRRNRCRAVTVTNSRWRQGLAGSLQTGLAAAPSSARAVLVTLCDQPAVNAVVLRRLVDAWRRRPNIAAAARYARGIGVPAILPSKLWRQLRVLEGDVGARAILRALSEVSAVDMPEAELDIDTAHDLEKLVISGLRRH